MDAIRQTELVPTDKLTEFKFNALTIEELFNHYEQVGFIYPDKLSRIAPFIADIKRNWKAVLRAESDLFCVVSAGSHKNKHLATLTFWRSTNNGWMTQHLTSTGNPFLVRAILLGTQVHGLSKKRYLSAQNWFQPTNKYANRIFGSITKTLSESNATVNSYKYLAVKRVSNTSFKSCGICRVDRDAETLRAFSEKIRGKLYAFAEELDRPDIELEALNDLYARVGLHRRRRCWLSFLPGRSEPIAGIIAYSGPLGLNFSFLENRCDLLCDPTLRDDIRVGVCTKLINQAARFQKTHSLGYLPVTTDDRTAKCLIATGSSLIRQYNQSIWLKKAFPIWYQHVEGIFHRVERRYLMSNTT